MITHLFCSQTLPKQLTALEKSGKKGLLAAAQCQRIIESIRNEGCITESVATKRTKNGEARIDNCIKYDLGSGYRLVTILEDGHLYIPFVGTHDETDQWISRHRCDGFSPTASSFPPEPVGHRSKPGEGIELKKGKTPALEPDPYEEYIESQLEESLLKSIFQGLHRQPRLP